MTKTILPTSLTFDETPTFRRKFEKLGKKKKYNSLVGDLELAKRTTIRMLHTQNMRQDVPQITGFANSCGIEFYKVRSFRCYALKDKGSRSGIRVIYAYHVNSAKVVFLEIYAHQKGGKDFDPRIIKDYLKIHCPN